MGRLHSSVRLSHCSVFVHLRMHTLNSFGADQDNGGGVDVTELKVISDALGLLLLSQYDCVREGRTIDCAGDDVTGRAKAG